MKVQVKLFGVFRDYAAEGSPGSSFLMELEKGARIADVLGRLGIPEDVPKTLVCNHRAGKIDQALKEGDTLAIFPPVEGGG
ncbi:MAG: MoaD/ThiS family protein [Deltaproteobacteria bacterium]|nr:MoaD/ThiS family protein [Deltaproteobacteria bacterium]MBW2206899.1 MoaD/ThiS family protein [Deltaproteobacteria bacterium]